MDETRHNEQGLTLAPGGAALPDATDPTAVGSAQTVIISPHHPAASGLRFGITGKLMLGLAILAVLTIATAGFALYSILGFSGQFAHVADRQVPSLIAATRLSQQSESIVAAAPALINATDQVARQSARLTLNDHFDWLTEVIDELSKGGANHDRLAEITRLKEHFVANITALDSLVTARIDLDQQLRNTQALLDDLARELDQLASSSATAPSHGALLASWAGKVTPMLRLLLAAGNSQNLVDLRAKEQATTAQWQMAEAIRAQLGGDDATRAGDIARNLQTLAQGPDSVFARQHDWLAKQTAIQARSEINRRISLQFTAAASQVVDEIAQSVTAANDDFRRGAERWVGVTLTLICACGLGLIASLFYVRQTVVRRLLALQRRMLAGPLPEIGIPGAEDHDEVGDIARALGKYQRLIFEREAALKRQQRALIEAKQSAEQASRAKSMFLAKMSHELRTPLNAIIGFSEIIRDRLFAGEISEAYRDYAANIHSSGRDLLLTIDQILDIARIGDAGETIQPQSLVAAALLTQVADDHAAAAAERGLTLRLDLPVSTDGQELCLRGDPDAVTQIIGHLLDNAIVYTPAGGRVTLAALAVSGGVEIAVIDTGIGIAHQHLERVVRPFEQGNQEARLYARGAGLGLPLAKALVEQHGGWLRLESEINKGTTATVFFPSISLVTPQNTAPAPSMAAPAPMIPGAIESAMPIAVIMPSTPTALRRS